MSIQALTFELADAAVRSKATRESLLMGLPDLYVSMLREVPNPRIQHLHDVGQLIKDARIIGYEGPPIGAWLQNLLLATQLEDDRDLVRRAAQTLGVALIEPSPAPPSVPEIDYADLEIRIQPGAGAYRVEMTLDGAQEFGPGSLDADVAGWRPSGVPGEDGVALFERLFADPALHRAWAQVRGQRPQRRVRLRIDASAPELHALPWELLRDPGGAVPVDLAAGTATPFSRYLAGSWPAGAPVSTRPFRVLVAIAAPDFAASPFPLDPIDADAEWAILDDVTRPMQTAGAVELVRLAGPCTLDAIEGALKAGFHALHFVGHGAYNAKARDASQQAVLFMADAQNQVQRVTNGEFADLLARLDDASEGGERLQLVFLGSCETASTHRADAFRGFGPSLVQAGVPAVIAMQDKVPVDTATEFARVFYRQLSSHGLVDRACNEARSAVVTRRLPGASMPVLYLRLKHGRLLA